MQIPTGHVRPRSSVTEETPAYIIDQLKGPASYLAESPNATRLGLCSSLIELWSCRFRLSDRTFMGLLPDTQNCELRMRRECREHFPCYRLQNKPLVIGPDMHHGTWQGTRSRHSRCMRNSQFYASGKRLMNSSVGARLYHDMETFSALLALSGRNLPVTVHPGRPRGALISISCHPKYAVNPQMIRSFFSKCGFISWCCSPYVQYFSMKLAQYNECLVSIVDTDGLVL